MQRLRNSEENCSYQSAIMQIIAIWLMVNAFLRFFKWTPPIQANRAVIFLLEGLVKNLAVCFCFCFHFVFFVFLPKFLVSGPIRPVPIVPGNFWLLEQLSEVLVTSSNFLPFWAIFEFKARIKLEKFYFCEILLRVKRGLSSPEIYDMKTWGNFGATFEI